jgi:hypothetical protein
MPTIIPRLMLAVAAFLGSSGIGIKLSLLSGLPVPESVPVVVAVSAVVAYVVFVGSRRPVTR